MTDYALALQTKPPSVDVATPLLTAARIRAADAEQRKNEFEYKQSVMGADVRGLVASADSPDFADKWKQTHQSWFDQGFIPQSTLDQVGSNPSLFTLHHLAAATQTPQMALAEKQFAETQKQHGQTFGLEQEKLAELKRQHDIAEEKPVSVPAGAALVSRQGREVFSNRLGSFDEDTISSMADQYLAGDKSVMTNLGRGAQGAENIAALRKAIDVRGTAAGLTPAQRAAKLAEFQGFTAGQRSIGTMEAKMGTAAFEAEGAIKLARDVIDKVPRTGFLSFNQLIQGFQKQTLSPEQAELFTRTQGVVNTYAAVMNRGASITTDASRHRAEGLLNTATNPAVYNRVLDTMLSEINMAKGSPERMREHYRKQYGGKAVETEGGGASPQTKVEYDNPAIVDARKALATGKLSRAEVEKRLRGAGITFKPDDLDLQ